MDWPTAAILMCAITVGGITTMIGLIVRHNGNTATHGDE